MDALLGRVVQLPRDALALGLHGQALAALALVAEPAQQLGRVGEREDDDERDHQVRRDDLQADGALERLAAEALGGDRHQQVGAGEHQPPPGRAPERQLGRREDERGQREDVERAAPVGREVDERERRRQCRSPTRRPSAAGARTRRRRASENDVQPTVAMMSQPSWSETSWTMRSSTATAAPSTRVIAIRSSQRLRYLMACSVADRAIRDPVTCVMPDDLDVLIDELYALPLERFVPERGVPGQAAARRGPPRGRGAGGVAGQADGRRVGGQPGRPRAARGRRGAVGGGRRGARHPGAGRRRRAPRAGAARRDRGRAPRARARSSTPRAG